MDNLMQIYSDVLRSALVPAPGKKFVCTDLSNIEGRVLAWVANEHWLLDAFRKYDRREGPDIYKLTYGRSFGITPDAVNDDQRQLGKVQCLALGYLGGVGAFASMAEIYRVDLNSIVEPVMRVASEDVVERSERSLKWAEDHDKTFGMPSEVYIACSVLKHAWRDLHPNIVKFWDGLDIAVRGAMSSPGVSFSAGKVNIRYGKLKFASALLIELPSGRKLHYYNPKMKEKEPEHDDPIGGEHLTFMGIDSVTRKWKRIFTHSGVLCENIVQAVARDIMLQTFPLIEAHGYPIVLSVHDEVLCEVPDDPRYNAEELSTLLSTGGAWTKGLPLRAEGWEGYFYRK